MFIQGLYLSFMIYSDSRLYYEIIHQFTDYLIYFDLINITDRSKFFCLQVVICYSLIVHFEEVKEVIGPLKRYLLIH